MSPASDCRGARASPSRDEAARPGGRTCGGYRRRRLQSSAPLRARMPAQSPGGCVTRPDTARVGHRRQGRITCLYCVRLGAARTVGAGPCGLKSLSPAASPPPPPPVSRRLPIRWPPSRSPSPSRFRRGRGNSAGPSKRKIWLPNTRSAGGRRRASEARVPTPLHARKARASGGAGAPDRPYARSSPLESLPREPAPARRDSSSLPVNHEGC